MKLNKILTSLIVGLTLTTTCFCTTPLQVKANADEEIEPLGWFTSISITINCGDRKVWATAKNSFTLFPSIVQVYVELYYSYEFEENYQYMTLVAKEYIGDLDQGNTLTVTATTNGETLYWKARVNFKRDNNVWKEQVTDTFLIDGDGNYISG